MEHGTYPATATLSPSGTLELTGGLPAEKDGLTVQFVKPRRGLPRPTDEEFAGATPCTPSLTTGEGKEPISAGAWDQGCR